MQMFWDYSVVKLVLIEQREITNWEHSVKSKKKHELTNVNKNSKQLPQNHRHFGALRQLLEMNLNC